MSLTVSPYTKVPVYTADTARVDVWPCINLAKTHIAYPRMSEVRAIIKDPRFAALHSDPRFARRRTSKTRVSDTRDERFAALETDEDFSIVGTHPRTSMGGKR